MTSSALRRAGLSLLLLCASSYFNTARAQTATPTPQTPPPPSPCKTRPEHRQFDFWVGEWDVTNPRGQQAGTSSVQLILGDCVVFENWTGARGANGKSFNVYNASKGKWQQTWVDNFGSILELFGEYKDGAMRLTGETKGQDGKVTLSRLTFTKLDDGRVRQLWEQSTDGGKSWTVAFDGTYVRKK